MAGALTFAAASPASCGGGSGGGAGGGGSGGGAGATGGGGTAGNDAGAGGGVAGAGGAGAGAGGAAGRDAGAADAAGGGGAGGGGGTGGGGAGGGGAYVNGPAGNPCVPGRSYGDPLPQSRTASMIRGGYTFLEGPVWVAAESALYFSDFAGTGTNGRIHKYTPGDGQLVVFVPNVGVNGEAVDPQGQIVAASHDMQRLTRFDPRTGARTQVPGGDMYMNAPFNSVNDVVVRADGHIYFTDPTYQQGGRPGQDAAGIYHLTPSGIVTRLATAMQPNGINLSPDGSALYVASTGGTPLRRFALRPDGTVNGNPTTVSSSGSDGMAVDCAGNLYLTTSGEVRVITPAGQALGAITGFGASTTNAAFGGADRQTLYVTAGRALFQLRLNVPGLPN